MFRTACLCLLLCLNLLLQARDEPPRSNGPAVGQITIEGRVSLQQALAKLTAQAKVTVVNALDRDDNPTIELSLKGVSFWEALDRIATAAGTQVRLYRDDGQIELIRQGQATSFPVSYSGLFRIGLRRLTTYRDFTQGTQGCTLEMEAAWEPTLEPFSLDTRPKKLVWQDDAGKAHPVAPAGSSWVPIDGKRALSFEVNVPALPRASRKIGLLRGVLLVRAPSRMHDFRWVGRDSREFTLLDLSKEKKPLEVRSGPRGTVTTLNRTRVTPDRWTVEIAVQLPADGPEFESFQTWYVHNEVYLASRDGKRKLKRSGWEEVDTGSKKAVLKYHFEAKDRGNAEDWILVCRAPASVLEIEVPFEFKGVELP